MAKIKDEIIGEEELQINGEPRTCHFKIQLTDDGWQMYLEILETHEGEIWVGNFSQLEEAQEYAETLVNKLNTSY